MTIDLISVEDEAFEVTSEYVRSRLAWFLFTFDMGRDWPPCAEAHRDLMYETQALLRWWDAANAPAAHPREASAWHDTLVRFRDRVRDARRRCGGGCCAPKPPA